MRKTSLFLATFLLASLPFQASAVVTNQTTETVCALGNGATQNYTISFVFQGNDDVSTYLEDQSTTPFTRTLLTVGAGASQYTITGGDPGTTVHLNTAPPATKRCIIQRTKPFTQVVDYNEGQAFPAEDHEKAMDKQVMLLQQINRNVNKKVGLHPASQASVPTFPDPILDRFPVYNHAGTDLTFAPSSAPSNGDILQFNGSAWVNQPIFTQFVRRDGTTALTGDWNAGAFNITALTFIGALTGNASTATALASNPVDCAANNLANVIAANGDLSCVQVTDSYIAAGAAISNSKLANMSTQTIKGRTTAGSGAPEDLTAAQATAIMNNFVGDSGAGGIKGLVLAPAAGDTAAGKFLKADGNWSVPVGAGDVTGPASSVDNELVLFNGVTGKVIKRAAGNGAVSVVSGVVTQGTLSVANGGTGATTHTQHNALIGQGSGAITSVSPSTAGNVFKSDGTDWASSALNMGGFGRNYGCTISLAGNALTATVVQASGSACSASAPCVFRVPTVASNKTTGTHSEISLTGAGTDAIVVSFGSTLGTTSTVENTQYVYLVNNAGTLEAAISGNPYHDPGTIITTTTEGGAGAADSGITLYSATGRTNVAVIGPICEVTSTQTAAGTWAQAVTSVGLAPVRKKAAAMSANGNPASATSGNPYIVPTVIDDPFGSYNSSTGLYTVPVAGRYVVCFFMAVTAAVSHTDQIFVSSTNTVAIATSAGTVMLGTSGCGEASAASGDTLSVRPNTTVDSSNASIHISYVGK